MGLQILGVEIAQEDCLCAILGEQVHRGSADTLGGVGTRHDDHLAFESTVRAGQLPVPSIRRQPRRFLDALFSQDLDVSR